jgi:hypothetical protein
LAAKDAAPRALAYGGGCQLRDAILTARYPRALCVDALQGGAYQWKPELEKKLPNMDKQMRDLCSRLLNYDNVPNKQKTFVNFCKNSLALNRQPHLAEKMWEEVQDIIKKPAVANQQSFADKENAKEAKKDEDEPAMVDAGDDDSKKEKKKKKKRAEADEDAEESADRGERKEKKKKKEGGEEEAGGDSDGEEKKKMKEKKEKRDGVEMTTEVTDANDVEEFSGESIAALEEEIRRLKEQVAGIERGVVPGEGQGLDGTSDEMATAVQRQRENKKKKKKKKKRASEYGDVPRLSASEKEALVAEALRQVALLREAE